MLETPITHIVVPGTFDPVTLGHIDVIKRAARLCPHVTVGVALSSTKHGKGTTFSVEERVDLVKRSLEEVAHADKDLGFLETIPVMPIEGLLVDFCKDIDAQAVVKGLRATTDFENELAQTDLYAKMHANLESVFVMSAPQYGFISSSMVREMASLGADTSLLVPRVVQEALAKKFA